LIEKARVKTPRKRPIHPGSYRWLIRNMDVIQAKCFELLDAGRNVDSVTAAVARHFDFETDQIQFTVSGSELFWRERRAPQQYPKGTRRGHA
jgi:hypothetical protein